MEQAILAASKCLVAGTVTILPLAGIAWYQSKIAAWGVFAATAAMIIASYPFTNPRAAAALSLWSLRLSLHLYLREEHKRVPLSTCVLWAFLIISPVIMDDDTQPPCGVSMWIVFAMMGLTIQTLADLQKWWLTRKDGHDSSKPFRAGLWNLSR